MIPKYLLVLVLNLVICEVSVYAQLIPLKYTKLSEDGRLTFPELAEKYGHPATTYEVTTDDGYILTVNRLPGNTSKSILLIHGNTLNSDCWILRGYGSIAIVLASLGYDVWAINLRGTRYSRKHISLDPDKQSSQFFNFSFYEQGIHDVPATIDFILNKTGEESLIAIGHSVGTTLLYVLGAEKPEYNDKIKVGICLAPVSYIQNSRGLTYLAQLFGVELMAFLSTFGIHEIATHHGTGALFRLFCLQPLGYELCMKAFLFGVMGYDPAGFEPEFTSTFFGHFPAGSSTKTIQHFVQINKRDRFAKFDYGKEKNMEEYGTAEPSDFDLKKVTMNTALIIGENDYMASVKASERLNASLPNVVHYQVLPYKKFSHADFVWGSHMNKTLIPFLLELIRKYE